MPGRVRWRSRTRPLAWLATSTSTVAEAVFIRAERIARGREYHWDLKRSEYFSTAYRRRRRRPAAAERAWPRGRRNNPRFPVPRAVRGNTSWPCRPRRVDVDV